MSTSGDELRAAMRRLASGIAVLTVRDGEEELGLTVGSLVSLSLEPPLIGVSIGRQTPLHEPLARAEGFTLSLLAGEQETLARHFARSGVPPVARWTGVDTHDGRFARRLDGALAWLECSQHASLPVGDHTFFVGEPVEIALDGREGPSLLYLRSEYHGL